MKHFIIIILLAFSLMPRILFGQSLSHERVLKIKSATVRVIVEGGISVGTGFIVNIDGLIVTCAHVVLPAFENNKKIYIEFNNSDTIEVGVPLIFNADSLFWKKALAYDFFILTPVRPITIKLPFLKLGDFDSAQEGDEIYTCGYPLGYPQQFISRGIISTKYENLSNSIIFFNKLYSFPRKEALMDITMNKGNSGGAIIRIGETIEEDEVIGLADFLINPIGNRADSIVNALNPKNTKGYIEFNTFDSTGILSKNNPNELATLFSAALGSSSIGVSGCIAINYLYDFLKPLK